MENWATDLPMEHINDDFVALFADCIRKEAILGRGMS